jgi:putative heme iron utilization protein
MNETTSFDSVISELLCKQRIASLATIDEGGLPHASMVPFALMHGEGVLLIHVSALSPHFKYLKNKLQAALLIAKPEVAGEEVHALSRVSIQADIEFVGASDTAYHATREAYVQRFPEAAFMTELEDFAFVKVKPLAGRVIAGFGAARKVDQVTLRTIIQNS